MADYSRISDDELRDLWSRYELGPLTERRRLAGGLSNTSMVITTDVGDFALTVCDEKNQQEIECLTAWLVQLEEQAFPSPRLIPTASGERFSMFRGHPVFVKEFIAGDVVPLLNENMLLQVGEALARLHAIEPHPSLPTIHPYGLDGWDDVLKGPVDHPFISWLSAMRDFLRENIPADLPTGFIHGDLFQDNMLFSQENLVAILDFEEACHLPMAFDLGMTIVGCCVRDHLISMKLVKALVAGYQSKRVLEVAERESLAIQVQYAATATAFWRFRQYHIRNPDVERAEAHLEIQALADQIREMPREEFRRGAF